VGNDGRVKVGKEGSIGDVRIGGAVLVLGTDDPDEFIRAILGLLITQHSIPCRSRNPATNVVFGTLEELGVDIE